MEVHVGPSITYHSLIISHCNVNEDFKQVKRPLDFPSNLQCNSIFKIVLCSGWIIRIVVYITACTAE